MRAALALFLLFSRTLTLRRLWNVLLIRFSYIFTKVTKRVWHLGMPVSVSIEPTTSCNLGCPECPSGLKQFTRPTGSLNLEHFNSVIDQLSPNLFYLTLYFQGEPYLNPHFLNMVKYAHGKRIFTTTSTNAHFLTERNAMKTVESGLDRLIISMDGTDQETYERYRVGGDLEKVKQGLANIVAAKKAAGSRHPFIELQFLVFSTNEHQIPEIRKIAQEFGVDKLELKTAQVYDFKDGNVLIPANDRYSRYKKTDDGQWVIKSKLPDHCFRMWQGCVITWDGKVVPCCFDKDASHRLGDLQQIDFRKVWRGREYDRFRKAVFSSRKDIDICSNCSEGLRNWDF